MNRFVLLLLVVALPAWGAKYKCKDADGNWTEAACTGAAAPPPREVADAKPRPSENNAEFQKMKDFCAAKWPTDFNMQKYCLDQQSEAARKIASEFTKDVPDDLKIAGGACALKWTGADDRKDWVMIEYCWRQQKEAHDNLRNR